MKGCVLLLVVFALGTLLSPLTSAHVLDLNLSLKQTETFIIKLPLTITSTLSDTDLLLKRANIDVPFEHTVKRFNSEQYISGITPARSGNYTLIINNAEFLSQGRPITEDIEISLRVSDDQAPYSLHPALFEGDSEAELVISSVQDTAQQLSTTIPGHPTITIEPGENDFSFSLASLRPGLNQLTIGTQTIFAYATIEDSASSNKRIRFSPNRISARLYSVSPDVIRFTIVNHGEPIKNFPISYNKKVFTLEPSTITELNTDESMEFTIKTISKGQINEVIQIEIDNETFKLPIEVEFTDNRSNLILPNKTTTSNGTSSGSTEKYYCSELQGRVCGSDPVCSSAPVETLDASACCLESCQIKPKTSYSWIGYLIGMAILIGLIIVGGRYLKTKNQSKEISLKV